MFDGFAEHELPTGRGVIFARVGGERATAAAAARLPADPPHVARRGAAAGREVHGRRRGPARLRGLVPPGSDPDHAAHSKRALAADLVEAMAELGHDRFAVAGHDRGGRVAYRMALDHPDRRARGGGARRRAHRRGVGPRRRRDGARLLALGVPRPARAATRAADRRRPRRVLRLPRPGRWASARAPDRYPADLMAAYRRLLDDPGTVQAICEDYRAGAGVDRDARRRRPRSAPDRVPAPRPVERPRGAAALLRRRPRRLAAVGPQVTGRGLDASHFLVEDQPEQVADLLSAFLDDSASIRRSVETAPRSPRR